MAAPEEPAAIRPPAGTLVLVLGGPIARCDVAGLFRHVETMIADHGPRLVVCDVSALGEPNLAAVDALARMQLAARGHGRDLHLRHASPALEQLLELTGLADVIPAETERTS